MSIYETETSDWKCVKGDSFNILYNIKEESDGSNKDITAYGATFNVRDPETDEIISALTKTHNDSVSGGDGIVFFGDTEVTPATVGITQNSQLVVQLTSTNTSSLDARAYAFDIQFTLGTAVTTLKGQLIISKEVTSS